MTGGASVTSFTFEARVGAARLKQCCPVALLDGAPAGIAGVGPAKGGRVAFSVNLPGHRICRSLDLFDAQTAESLLPGPCDLSAHFAFEVTGFALAGLVVHGSFVVRDGLDAALLVELIAKDLVLGRCFALRGDAAAGPVNATGGAARATYAFSWPLPSLCPLDRTYELGLRIAGLTLTDGPTLTVDAQAVGRVGYVDRAEAGLISGWALDLANPRQRLGIELWRDGRCIATRLADQTRPDLRQHGLGDGRSAFSFNVPEMPVDGAPVEYAVRLAGTTTQLANSPVQLQPAGRVIGFFDEISSGCVGGWVCNYDTPNDPVEVEVVCDDEIICSGLANIPRLDVERAGLPTANCGFRINIPSAVLRAKLGRPISVRARGLARFIDGSPRLLEENPNLARFLDRGKRLNERSLLRLKRRLNHRARGRELSIIMPVHDTPQAWLIEALESVRSQWCDNWELICVNDHSRAPHVAPILDAYARHDPRIRVLTTGENVGIARATNFGLRAARCRYVTFMDHDDYIEPDAVYCLLRTIIDTSSDFIYTDEVITHEDLNSIKEVRARPAFSHDYYLSHPYFVHMICVRTELAMQIAGWDEMLSISADIDFVLRILEVARTVTHVPKVLYRWRTHAASTGHTRQSQVMAATRSAIARHLSRRGVAASVSDGVFFNQFRIDYPVDSGEILIVIPTRNKADLLRTCIDSIARTTQGIAYRIVVIDHESNEPDTQRYLRQIGAEHHVMPYKGVFNFARMNNIAVRKFAGRAKYILFCNNDIEAIDSLWLDRLRSLANRPEVGAVGPMLLYGDKRIQHAGVIVGFNNAAEHVGKFADAFIDADERRNLGYNCTFSSLRDFSAVTAACMLLRLDVFEDVGGFDEDFAIGFNDTDLCLRIRAAGYKVLYDGCTMLFHHESATRSLTKQVLHPIDDGKLRRRWAKYFAPEGDPFYNPILDLRSHDHALRDDAGCRQMAPPRVTRLPVAVTAPVEVPLSAARAPAFRQKPRRVPLGAEG